MFILVGGEKQKIPAEHEALLLDDDDVVMEENQDSVISSRCSNFGATDPILRSSTHF